MFQVDNTTDLPIILQEIALFPRKFVANPFLVVLIFCSAIHLPASSARSQELNAAELNAPDLMQDGPMQKVSDVVQEILRLNITDDNRLALDKENWKANDNDLEAKRKAAMVKQLMARGMDQADANRIADNQKRTRIGGAFDGWFREMQTRGMTTMGTSTRNNVRTISCSGAVLSCSASFFGEDLELKIMETPGRQLTLNNSENLVRLMFTGDDSIAILSQSNSGNVTGVLTGEQVLAGTSIDFKEFGRDHPELSQQLKQVFSHAGVDFPPTMHDLGVKQRVLTRIRAIYSNSSAELDALIQKLDASEFTIREAATKKIESGYEHFESWIANRIADESLTPEAKKRLAKIVKDAQSESPQDPRVDQCIDGNKLLQSPEFLVELLDTLDSDDQLLVMKLLGDLTQEKFGDDIIAWKQWAKENKTDE